MSAWIATDGLPPIGDGPFLVRFRSGWISGPFTRAQIRWVDAGSQWCVVAVQRAAKGQETVTWKPDHQLERVAA